MGPGEFEDFRTTTDPGGLFMCTNASDGDGGGSNFEFPLLKMSYICLLRIPVEVRGQLSRE